MAEFLDVSLAALAAATASGSFSFVRLSCLPLAWFDFDAFNASACSREGCASGFESRVAGFEFRAEGLDACEITFLRAAMGRILRTQSEGESTARTTPRAPLQPPKTGQSSKSAPATQSRD